MIKPTAQGLVDAALETVRSEGFAGASSRAIATRGGFNQALVFYYFGSLENLLLAALEQASSERLGRYRAAVEGVDSVDALIPVMADLWEEDKAAGHVRAISQMVAGAVSRPELSQRLLEVMQPWFDLAEETVARVLPPLAPARETAFAIVTFYLGVNLMTNLDPTTERTDAFFTQARALAPVLTLLLALHEPLARLREAQVDLRGGRVGPARRDDLRAGVEVDPLRPVDVPVAEERGLPAAEAVVGDGHRDRDVDPDHAGLHLELELAGDTAVAREDRGPVAVRVLVDEATASS